MEIITAMTGVFDAVFTWIVGALETVLSLFYTSEGLTIFGILAIVGLSIAIFMLILNIISNFFRLRY